MNIAYEILTYKTESDFDTMGFEIWDTGYLSMEAALATVRGNKLLEEYAVVKVQSSDREELEILRSSP